MRTKVKRDVPLAERTTFRIGGAARFFMRPADLADLRAVLAAARSNRLPVFVLGKGSNILVPDTGVRGVVLALDAPAFTRIRCDGARLTVGAGVTLAAMLAYCIRRGLSGAECLAGIPGTVGGALAMNAGITFRKRQRSIGDLVESVLVMDYNSTVKLVEGHSLRFGYRSSCLARYVILAATLRLRRDTAQAVRKRAAYYLRLRRADRQWTYPNAGCIFKNPPHRSAGRLIDGCGLKGARCGGAMIWEDHANFIVNVAGARSRDVLRLMRLAQSRVQKKYHLRLEPEIKLWQ